MGFSVSGSATVVFVGFVVAAGIAVPSIVGSVGELASAQGEQIDRGTDALNTGIEVRQTIFEDGDPGTLTIVVENTGSTTLQIADTSVLVDGDIVPDSATKTAIDDDANVTLWLPTETLEIEIERDSPPDVVKVVTENGIERTDADVEVVGE